MVLWRRYFYGVSEQIPVLLLPHLNPCHPFHCQITKRLFLAPWFGHWSKNYQNKSRYTTDLQQRTLFHISYFLKNPFIDLSKVMKLSPLSMNYNMIYPITLEWAWAHIFQFTTLVLPSNTTCIPFAANRSCCVDTVCQCILQPRWTRERFSLELGVENTRYVSAHREHREGVLRCPLQLIKGALLNLNILYNKAARKLVSHLKIAQKEKTVSISH